MCVLLLFASMSTATSRCSSRDVEIGSWHWYLGKYVFAWYTKCKWNKNGHTFFHLNCLVEKSSCHKTLRWLKLHCATVLNWLIRRETLAARAKAAAAGEGQSPKGWGRNRGRRAESGRPGAEQARTQKRTTPSRFMGAVTDLEGLYKLCHSHSWCRHLADGLSTFFAFWRKGGINGGNLPIFFVYFLLVFFRTYADDRDVIHLLGQRFILRER